MANNSNEEQAKEPKSRHNIALPPDARELGERLAKEDLRSFSNLLDWLIKKEWERRHPHGAEESTAQAA